LKFVSEEPDWAVEWQAALTKPLVIVARAPHQRKAKLIFDGRLWHQGSEDPVCWILSSVTGKLVDEKDNISQLPLQNMGRKFYFSPTPLWQLLNLDTPFPDPQTWQELNARTEGIAVRIFIGKSRKCLDRGSDFILEAGTDQRYKIIYRDQPRPKDVPVWLELEEEEDGGGGGGGNYEGEENEEDPCQTNRSTSVSIHQSSLNLAYSLGLISSSEEHASLSLQLGATVGSLAVHTDEENHLRHIFYTDAGGSTFEQEVTCFDDQGRDLDYRRKAGESMLTFWRQVWARKAQLTAQRQAILQPLLDKLDSHPAQRTLYAKCLKDLNKCIQHQWIVLYSATDNQIHSLKFYLTHFACVDLKKRGLCLKTSSDNDINALCTTNLTLFNIQTYLDLRDASQFYAPHWTPPPTILHSTRDLKHQPKTPEGATVRAVVRQRAKWMSQAALNFWQTFVANCVKNFGVDLHACNAFKACSTVSFECVWTLFSRLAGPMAQGPEKLKPYYEEMLRKSSRGGFMFSAETFLKQGRAEDGGFEAIMEYDLTSAYGFSASNALMPSGFCTGFLQPPPPSSLPPSAEDSRVPWLEKTDTYIRHKSFEFKAVYYTLANLSDADDIRTVYSNFSPMGLFYVDKYPADLVIVYNDGRIDIYQFDGHYVHGCTQGCVHKRYINNQTREQVCAKTEKRDAVFEQWIGSHRGQSARYIVISDCHTAGYTPWSLEKSFRTHAKLAHLIKGYQLVDATSTLTLQDFESMVQDQTDTSYTFIAWIEGHTAQPSWVVYHPDSRKNLLADATLEKQAVVLTRDYYNYLKANQSLRLTNIKAILFFRTEPTMNVVYERLIQQRATSTCPIQVAWIKRLVNLSCGYFGVTSGGKRFKFTLTNKLPPNYHYSRHRIDVNYMEDLNGGDDDHRGQYFLLETTHRSPKFRQKNALAMFVTVVETGKLRLVQIIQFIARHLSPQNWSLVYSNIDNLIIAIRGGASLDEAVLATAADQGAVENYLAEKPFHLVHHPGGPAQPGMAKLEWLCNLPRWQFITPMIQNYALVTDHEEKDVHKSSGWSSLSNRQAFDTAYKMMFGQAPVVIPQERRVHKLASMATAPMNIVVQPRRV